MAAAQILRPLFPGGIHLLREESKWWKRARWEPFGSRFAAVHAFKRVETCRGLRDLPRLYRESAERRLAIGELPIDPAQDMIFCIGGILTISNATASAHPQVRKVLCISAKVYRQLHQAGARARYRFTTSGWLQNRIVEPMAGLHRTLRFKPRMNAGGDGVRLERLQKVPEEFYDAIVVMSNSGHDIAADAPPKIVASCFPTIAELRDLPPESATGMEKQRVIFFGTPFDLIHNLSPQVYIEYLNRCLDYLRANFRPYDLIYRPHPNETGEAQRLNLERFRIEDDREAAELYFLRHFASIAAVFSVSSTVSRTAFNNGLNAYAMYPLFPFSKQQAEFFSGVMGEVPRYFHIRDLHSAPVAYQPVLPSNDRSFDAGLLAAVAAVHDRRTSPDLARP